MTTDLNILLDLGFSLMYNNEDEVTGYRLYIEDLNGFIVMDLNKDLYFGLEVSDMDHMGNFSDIMVGNIQEIVPSIRYYIFKQTTIENKISLLDKFKGIFLRGVNV